MSKDNFDYSGELIRKMRYIDVDISELSLEPDAPSITFEYKIPISGVTMTKWAYWAPAMLIPIEDCFDKGKRVDFTVHRKRRKKDNGEWKYIDIIIGITYKS